MTFEDVIYLIIGIAVVYAVVWTVVHIIIPGVVILSIGSALLGGVFGLFSALRNYVTSIKKVAGRTR